MKLLKYIKEYRFSAIIGFVFKIAEAALELMVPLVVADIIDIGIKTNDKNYILMKGLGIETTVIANIITAKIIAPIIKIDANGPLIKKAKTNERKV